MTEPIEIPPNLDQEAPNQSEAPKKRKRRSQAELLAAGIAGPNSDIGGSASSRRSKADKELELCRDALAGLFTIASFGISFVDQIDGTIVLEKAPGVIDALIELARRNEQVRRVLMRFSETSAYGQLATAVLMMAIPIAANHGLVPVQTIYVASLSDATVEAILKRRYNAAHNEATVE